MPQEMVEVTTTPQRGEKKQMEDAPSRLKLDRVTATASFRPLPRVSTVLTSTKRESSRHAVFEPVRWRVCFASPPQSSCGCISFCNVSTHAVLRGIGRAEAVERGLIIVCLVPRSPFCFWCLPRCLRHRTSASVVERIALAFLLRTRNFIRTSCHNVAFETPIS